LGFRGIEQKKVEEVVATLKSRSKTLLDMAEGARFYFADEITYDEKADEKFFKPDVLGLLEDLHARLDKASQFDQVGLEKIFMAFLEDNEIKLKKVAQPLRVALTGKTASPGIFEVMEVLGKEKVLTRIEKSIIHIRSK
jgi:glutamyl-tRNA synthetase